MEFKLFKKNPERVALDIIQRYFGSHMKMSDEDFRKLCENVDSLKTKYPGEYRGAMAYISYRKGNLNDMWRYIDEDLMEDKGEEEYGAFIPAMMADVPDTLRYEILLKIYTKIGGYLALQQMAEIAPRIGKVSEVREMILRELEKSPKNRVLKSILKKLD